MSQVSVDRFGNVKDAGDFAKDLLTETLPKLAESYRVGKPDSQFFRNGIELISATVKVGSIEVSLTVAGKDAKVEALAPKADQAIGGSRAQVATTARRR